MQTNNKRWIDGQLKENIIGNKRVRQGNPLSSIEAYGILHQLHYHIVVCIYWWSDIVVSETKTKPLEVGQNTTNDTVIAIKTEEQVYKFDGLNTFEYIGVTIRNNVNECPEIEKRISKGSGALDANKKLFKSKMIFSAAK